MDAILVFRRDELSEDGIRTSAHAALQQRRKATYRERTPASCVRPHGTVDYGSGREEVYSASRAIYAITSDLYQLRSTRVSVRHGCDGLVPAVEAYRTQMTNFMPTIQDFAHDIYQSGLVGREPLCDGSRWRNISQSTERRTVNEAPTLQMSISEAAAIVHRKKFSQ